MKDQKNREAITIVIASYNHDKYISDCIRSVINLKINKEIIIIDDGSQDDTVNIINEYIKIKNDIIFIKKEFNSGLVSSLNKALSLATSDFIYFIASDDFIITEGFEQLYTKMVNEKEKNFIIGGGFNIFDNKEKTPIYNKRHRDFFSLPIDHFRKKLYTDYPKPLLLQSTIFRTDAIKDIGGWDSELELDDYPTFIKLLNKENFIFFDQIPIVYYRHHDNNSSKKILRQYSLVKNTLSKLSPIELKDIAISKRLGFYILLSIKHKKFLTIVELTKKSSIKQNLLAWFYIPQLLTDHLRSK